MTFADEIREAAAGMRSDTDRTAAALLTEEDKLYAALADWLDAAANAPSACHGHALKVARLYLGTEGAS